MRRHGSAVNHDGLEKIGSALRWDLTNHSARVDCNRLVGRLDLHLGAIRRSAGACSQLERSRHLACGDRREADPLHRSIRPIRQRPTLEGLGSPVRAGQLKSLVLLHLPLRPRDTPTHAARHLRRTFEPIECDGLELGGSRIMHQAKRDDSKSSSKPGVAVHPMPLIVGEKNSSDKMTSWRRSYSDYCGSAKRIWLVPRRGRRLAMVQRGAGSGRQPAVRPGPVRHTGD